MSSSTVEIPTTEPSSSSSAATSVETTTTSAQQTTCLGTVDSYPAIPGNPTITNVVLTASVRFDCKLQAAESGSIYYVSWATKGTSLKNSTLVSGDLLDSFDTAGLAEALRKSILNKGITCSVRVSNPARCGNGISPPYNASLDLTILTVTPPSQTILAATTETSLEIAYQNHMSSEYYCMLMYGKSCLVLLEVQTSQVDLWKCIGGGLTQAMSVRSIISPTSGAGDVCGTQMSSKSKVFLRPSVDNIVRKAVNVTVYVQQVDFVDEQRVKSNPLDTITFTVESSLSKISTCRVYGDPHIVTFDGLAYDVMFAGRFLVYKHKDFDLEVEGFFSVTGKGTSACGFAIRSGDDVIRVSKCDPPMATKLFLLGDQLTPHTKIFQEEEGNKIKVFLPTGTVVIVTGADEGIVHLEIRPSALDFGRTEGLCGSYDGDSTNDLTSRFGMEFTLNPNQDPNDFSGTWSVSESDSLYGGYQGASTSSSFTDTYCSCQLNSNRICDNFGFVAECGVSTGEDITQTLIEDYQLLQALQQTQTSSRRKRQASTNREVFTYDTNFNASNSGAIWPTASGITEAVATQYCENSIRNSPVYSACSDFSADNFDTEIKNCIRDIKLTDNLNWAGATVLSIQENCGTNVAVNSSLWQDNNPDQAAVSPSLGSSIVNTLCPNQCSGRGTCKNGLCDCSFGFSGIDCSFEVTLAPTVIAASSNSLCQESELISCNRTIVRGDNFMKNVGTLTCHLTPIVVTESGISSRGTTLKTAAVYRNQYEVLCDVPVGQSYAIKISNDGASLSQNEALFVYNPKCKTCQVDSSSARCTNKALTCFIDGQCYNNGDTSTADPCLVCSLDSYTSWSPNPVEGCQGTGPSSTTSTTTEGRVDDRAKRFDTETIIIAASTASVIVSLVIIGIVAYVVRRRQRRHRQNQLTSNSDNDSSTMRVYNGTFGKQKSLPFRNPTQYYDYYEPTIDRH